MYLKNYINLTKMTELRLYLSNCSTFGDLLPVSNSYYTGPQN